MATFVIVHGGWVGGWYMRPLAKRLEAKGHDVFTPTLTGLGERVHLASPEIRLDTQVTDITNVLVYEDLWNVILVGKSYSGMVITGAAEKVPERIACLVYVNGFVPESGQSAADMLPREFLSQLEAAANAYGDGWRFPAAPGAPARITPLPAKPAYDKLQLTNPAARDLPRVYIFGTEHPDAPIFAPVRAAAARAKAEGWHYRELPTGHEPERDMPDELAVLLDEVARDRGA